MRPKLADFVRSRRASRRAALTCALLLGAALGTTAADEDLRSIRGYVDGSMFLELADEQTTLVEVSLPPSLLKLALAFIPTGEGTDELAEAAAGLEWVGAVILEFPEGTPRRKLERVEQLVDQTRSKLERQGWARLARIREPGSAVDVMVLNDETSVSGLVVMVHGENEIVFTNVAGIIDMEKLKALGERIDIPGLNQIEDGDD